jgi:hypothetical protein
VLEAYGNDTWAIAVILAAVCLAICWLGPRALVTAFYCLVAVCCTVQATAMHHSRVAMVVLAQLILLCCSALKSN